MRSLRNGVNEEFDAYCVVPDKDFVDFVEAEAMAFKAEPESETQYDAMAVAAKLSGTMMQCPDCNRLLMVGPGDNCRYFVEEPEGE
jgi:hypothetical protein